MNALPLNTILNREQTETQIREILASFDSRVHDIQFKKGIYIYGSPGTGKTQFVMNLLKSMNYDVINYDAGDVRNKTLVDTITSNNVSRCNVLNMMRGKIQKIAIVMDEIDGMNSGDKGGITSLIKLIRQKKTRKQKSESITMNPVICIGNYFVDKKIKELMKVCHTFELATPTTHQIQTIIYRLMPTISATDVQSDILHYIQGDLRKLSFVYQLFSKRPDMLTQDMIRVMFCTKSYNDDSKSIVRSLFKEHVPIERHNTFMNETDRTTVALLWHENVVDAIQHVPKEKAYPFYLRVLDNICFADYIDRITFQSQIWSFNEMSSLMKTFYNNKLYHDLCHELTDTGNDCDVIGVNSRCANSRPKMEDIRFTKVLTKYSTEYNNLMFVFSLCQELDMDRKDMISFFQELRLFYGNDFCSKTEKLASAEKLFADTGITKLDIKRVYRYLDKTVKRDVVVEVDSEDDLELE